MGGGGGGETLEDTEGSGMNNAIGLGASGALRCDEEGRIMMGIEIEGGSLFAMEHQ